MNRIMVTYKVKAEKVEQNERLVKGVYEQLRRINHPDIHYATYKLPDGQTFVHIAMFASDEGRQAFGQNEAFKTFQKELNERCEIPPKPEALTEIGSYNFV